MTIQNATPPELASVGATGSTPRDKLAARFERRAPGSNFESMCERWAERRAQVGVECEACEGLGYRLFTPGEMAYWKDRIDKASGHTERDREQKAMTHASKCKCCKGTGYLSQRPGEFGDVMDVRFTTVGCYACRGRDKRREPEYPKFFHTHAGSSTGRIRVDDEESAALESWETCSVCGGEGYIVPITARPTMKTQDERDRWTGEGEDDPGFELFVRMHPEAAPRLAPAEAIRDVDALAIVALWGEAGDRWAQHDWGRLFALWPFTDAGSKLADESSHGSAEPEWYARRLAAIAHERREEEGATDGSPRRRVLISQADTQARTLEHRVAEALRAMEAA